MVSEVGPRSPPNMSEPPSLRRQLPFSIGALLLITVLALVTAAYLEVRGQAERAATERLASATRRFADLFQQSTAQLRTSTAAAAANPDLRATGRRLRDALARVDGAVSPEQAVATELRTAQGATVLSTAPGRLDSVSLGSFLSLGATQAGRDSAAIGDFRLVDGAVIYPVAARVSPDRYLVRWRRLGGTARAREQVNRLVGDNASLFLGSAGGGVWTDLERATNPPHADTTVVRTAGVIATARPISGTPWNVAITVPERVITEPVAAFLRRMALIALAAIAIGLAITWLMSRRLTAPLLDLTTAAAAIAGGDYARRVSIRRHDELGRLGDAFSTMAAEVQHTRDDLERRVAERTQELHDAQEALVRKERLAMLGQLSSGVGHELRNPLGVMNNAVYYLKTVLHDASANVREYLDIIQQQITLSEKIVGDLLDFARSKPPQRAPVRILDAARAELARFAPTEQIRVEVHVPEHLPPALVDRTQLGQILVNLLTNATQAIDGAGRITLSARAEHGRICCDVTDTGPGVPRENLDRIFEPLFTTKARGIGLGLAVSRALARANGGDLTVHSIEGQGATFTVTLPAAVEVPPGASILEAPSTTARIL